MTIVKPQQFQVTIEQKKQLTKTVFFRITAFQWATIAFCRRAVCRIHY